MEFDLLVLDLTSVDIQMQLGIKREDLISDDLNVTQTLADLAAEAGFDAVVGPSAAFPDDTTVAVIATAIATTARTVVDRGVRTPP